MTILDRYILRRFAFTLGIAMIPFTFVVIFVDMVGNLAKFIDKNVPNPIVFEYYLFYVPQIVVLALPIAMLLASLFSLGQMARHNELTAIKSAGVSPYRTFVPLFLLSVGVSLAALAFNENVVPPANQKKRDIQNRFLNPFGEKSRRYENNVYLRDALGRRVFIGQFDYAAGSAEKVTIQRHSAQSIIERIDAPRMEWQDSVWVLFEGYTRRFEGELEQAIPFDTLYDRRLGFGPEDLSRFKIDPEDMSYAELKAFVREVRRNGADPNRWLVDLHFKLAVPFANFILVLFGVPLASSRNRSGALFGFMVSLIICFIYYGSNQMVKTLAAAGALPPAVAAWATNGVFFFGAMGLIYGARR